MQTIIAFWMLYYCLSFGFWFLGNTLNVPSIAAFSVNFNTESTKVNIAANQTASSSASLSSTTIFADIPTSLSMVWTLFTGGGIINILGPLFGAADSSGAAIYFTLPIQLLVGFVQALGLFYIISSRATNFST